MNEDKGLLLELVGYEAADWSTFRVYKYKYPGGDVKTVDGPTPKQTGETVRLVVEVVGLKDTKAPTGDWGKKI